jgi:hypothetical protein
MNATTSALTITTHGDLEFVRDGLTTVVYEAGMLVGEINPDRRIFTATYYIDDDNSVTRLFSTYQHAYNAFKYGYDWSDTLQIVR